MDSIMMVSGGVITICCLVFVTTGAAILPDQISIITDQDEISAGSAGTCIHVETDSALPHVASATFTYLNSSTDVSGTLSTISDSTAPFETHFTSTKAGTAYIRADVTFTNASVATSVCSVKVIPADPYRYESIVRDSVQVATVIPITVRMEDKYGNPITEETGARITFSVTTGGAGFVEGNTTTRTYTAPFTSAGDCTVSFHAPEKAGPVVISVCPSPGSGLQRLITVEALPERIPASITPHIVAIPQFPEPNTCPADGISYFKICYIVKDRFGNTIDNLPVTVTTSLGEAKECITNEDGIACFTYGPKTGLGDVRVTATSGAVTITSILSFTGGLGSRFSVTINPNSLPSRDVDPDALIAVQAHIYNDLGTGVPGETVRAWITNGSVSSATPMTAYPGLSADPESGFGNTSFTGVTNENGFATFWFRAGAFPTYGEEGYNASAKASATVTAMWGDETARSPVITWRNYPYLRVETEVSDTAIAPGDPLDVTIRLIGDGSEMFCHDPIDVVLCLDRGEDMLKDEGAEDRMERAREAAKYLIRDHTGADVLRAGDDQIALVTYSDTSTDTTIFINGTVDYNDLADTQSAFNWIDDVGPGPVFKLLDEGYVATHYPGNGITGYADYATVDEEFAGDTISDWTRLEAALLYTMPFKNGQTGEASAPLRYGLKKSIEYLEDNSRTGAIRAIVVLMQNNYLYFGDPFAGGKAIHNLDDALEIAKDSQDYYYFDDLEEQQNMVTYARENDIRIYTIYYHGETNNQKAEEVAYDLANETGGAFYDAADEAELATAFAGIRDTLLRDAGTKTSVNLNFANLPEDISYSADDVMTYLPNTTIDFYNWSTDPLTADADAHLSGYPCEVDQSVMWQGEEGGSPASLSFTVGNVTIKQTWTASFSLLVNESLESTLNFSLFADGSYIEFVNREGENITEPLPETQITIVPGLTPEMLLNASLQITGFNLTSQNAQTAQFTWNVSYDGEFPLTAELALKNTDDEDDYWPTVDAVTVTPETTSGTSTAFIGEHLSGTYTARIKVSSEDAGYDTSTLPLDIGGDRQFFIRLE